jgi:hypothetical protein
MTQVAKRIFGAVYDPPENMWLAVLFSPSEAAQAAGMEFLKRKYLRQEGRDPEVNAVARHKRERRYSGRLFLRNLHLPVTSGWSATYLGITSGLPVTRQESCDGPEKHYPKPICKYWPTPKEHQPFSAGMT